MTEQLRYSNSSSPRYPIQSRKVKLLCSCGGKILPRPTDGQLRYIGGHMRIVSVPKTVTFEDLMAKMSEVNGGGTVVMKYQLPDEDLDALISVSCGEDLENMLEEYERIIANDPAGKIRVFLFGADGGSDGNAVTDLNDTGQRYFEAVNGISNDSSGSSIGSLKRKDSGLSAGSSNSGIEAAENFSNNTVFPPQTLNYANQVFLDPNLLQFSHTTANLATLTANPTQTNNLKSNENYTRNFQPPLSQFPPFPHVFAHSQQVEALDDCYMCQKMLPHAHSDTIAQNIGNGSSTTRSEISPVFYSQHSEDSTRNLIPQPQNLGVNLVDVGKQPFIRNMETIDHSTAFIPPPEAQPSYGLFMGNFPQAQTAIPSQIPINPQVIAKPLGSDFLPVISSETSNKTINGMEGIHLNPTNAHAMPETPHMVVDYAYVCKPQIGGNVMYHDSQFIRPMDQMPSNTSDTNRIQNYTTMVESQGPFPPHIEPPMPSEGLLGMPTYMYHGNRVMNTESPHLELHDLLSGSDTLGLSSATNAATAAAATATTKQLDAYPDCSPVDSLFSNQDPRKMVGGTHQLPPKPKRIASSELIDPKDSGVQVHLGNSTESDIIALLEEGGLHRSTDGPNKQVRDFIASEDEQIKQDLQAVAEGVASSVLNSPSSKDPIFFACDPKEINSDNVSEAMLIYTDRKLEDNKSKAGLQITEDIGRLQIIKNSDLEELRELGSGTFGTVYHGKWRGSDVAIKRINDRCFVGKPSEQEKMRTDFWNEACKLADLHHPNVVAFYGVVLDGPGGSVATVTEYMVNGSLRNALQKNDKVLDKRKRLLIAMDVAFGMEYLHGKNIVHFDLKSDNLLVNLRDPQRPICKVGDLGLSKVKCQTLISGGVRGTLPWMAPELLNGGSSLVSEKVDVFSFGIVMWELITGEEPYADLHYGAIIGGIVSNTLRPPIPENCDPEWRALMEKCWSAEPSERPCFTEIAETLRIMASSLPQKTQKVT